MLIREKDKQRIIYLATKILKQPAKLCAFGSRVSGEAHDMSDLDLVIISSNAQKIDINELIEFKKQLKDSNIPILVEVIDWHRVPKSFHKNILKNCEEMIIIKSR